MNLNFIRLIVGKIKTKIYTFYVQQHIKSCGKGLRVNELSHISGKVRIGNNCHFNGVNIIGDDVIIGNNCHFGHQIQIIATNHNYDYGKTLPYDSTFINKKVVLENNVWVGNNAIILGGVHIGEGAIIQAGAVVVTDIQKCGIAGGNPARVFKFRNLEHYEELKRMKKFH